jgi:DNA-binding GntR family transcriptional regulator
LRVLEGAERPPTPEEAERLELAAGERVFSIRRLFFAAEEPVALIDSCIAAEGLARDVPASEGSIPPHKFLELYHRRKPHDGELHFLAVCASEAQASLLKTPPGSPLLSIEGIYYDDSRRPLMLVSEVYRGQEGFEMQTGLRS